MKLEIDNFCELNDHIMKITAIEKHNFGKIISMSCYDHCCTIPNIMEIKCSEEDALIFRNNYLIKQE